MAQAEIDNLLKLGGRKSQNTLHKNFLKMLALMSLTFVFTPNLVRLEHKVKKYQILLFKVRFFRTLYRNGTLCN